VDVASIATDEPNRDDYFRNDAMKASQNPTATFVLTSPIPAPADGSTSRQTASATGELTLAGVTRPVTAEITVGLDGDSVKLAGSIPITFEDFGVTAPNLGFVSVEPTGDVEFLVVLTK
jgi:polyisoprenoid-binding protein YceI